MQLSSSRQQQQLASASSAQHHHHAAPFPSRPSLPPSLLTLRPPPCAAPHAAAAAASTSACVPAPNGATAACARAPRTRRRGAAPAAAAATSSSSSSAVVARAAAASAYAPSGDALENAIRRDANVQTHMVQWYPGHIAKAERQLKEQLKMVDVVLEVRDARIPIATNHPQVPSWVGPKPMLLVMNRVDMVTPADRRAWAAHYKAQGQPVFWTDGKKGAGAPGLKAALLAVSESINAKRSRRGLQPRPVRACVIGFPNIGKSALINRLLARRAMASAPKPGVTRMLQWARLSGELDLLDAPGVIPAAFNDQVAAQRLAICNDIGEASYIDSAIAGALVIRCKLLPAAPALLRVLWERYGVDPLAGTAEDFVVGVADKLFFGDIEKAGIRILKDYRAGYLGNFALELPIDLDKKAAREAAAVAAAAAARQRRIEGSEDGFE